MKPGYEGRRWRKVRFSEVLFHELGLRHVEWGEPDNEGFYTPTITLSLAAEYDAEVVAAERTRIRAAVADRCGHDLRELAQDAESALHCAWPTMVLRILAILDGD